MRDFRVIACGYWTAPAYRHLAWLISGGLALVAAGSVGLARWLNVRNRDLFNALEQENLRWLWIAGRRMATARRPPASLSQVPAWKSRPMRLRP